MCKTNILHNMVLAKTDGLDFTPNTLYVSLTCFQKGANLYRKVSRNFGCLFNGRIVDHWRKLCESNKSLFVRKY